jgi:hypothetical protein
MITRTKFTRATGLIPQSENLKDRNFIIHSNNLYFIGDTSWFKIENFMDCDSDISLSHNALTLGLGLGGTLCGTKEGTYGIVLSNGDQSVTVNCGEVTEVPSVKLLDEGEYRELSNLFPLGRNIFGLMDRASIVGAVTVDRWQCIICANNRLMAVVAEEGSHENDIDLTRIESVITSAITNKAKASIGKRKAHFLIDEATYKVYSCCSAVAATLSDRAVELASEVLNGTLEDVSANTEERPEVITIEIEGRELSKIIHTIEKIKSSGLTFFEVKTDGIVARTDNMLGTKFEATLQASATRSTVFEAKLVDKQMLEFLGAVSGKVDNEMFRLSVNIPGSKIVIRASSTPEGMSAFIVMGANFSTWSNKDSN